MTDIQWLDSVNISLGNCYTNITPHTPNNISSNFFNTEGNWQYTYFGADNSLVWEFENPINQLGDGNQTEPYSCTESNGLDYDFCFNTKISPTCTSSSGLEFKIGIGAINGTSVSYDTIVIADISLQIPEASFTYNKASYCTSEPNSLPNITGHLGGTFSVTPTGLIINPSTGEINFSLSTQNDYKITYSTYHLCPTATETFNLSIISNPTISEGMDITICDNIDTMLTAINPDGASILWNNSIIDGSLFNPMLGTTTYEVTVTLFGCTSTDQINVIVKQLPIVEAGDDITMCKNIDTLLNADHTTGSILSWYPPNITDSVRFSQPPGTLIYIATANLFGCLATDEVVITVNPLPFSNAGSNSSICENTIIALNATVTNGAEITWNQNVTDGVAFTPPVGVNTYIATATLLTCSSIDELNITVKPLPSVEARVDIIICDNIDTMLTAVYTAGASISWNNGITNGVLFNQAVGTESYISTAVLNQCTNTVDVTIKLVPSVNAGVDISICEKIDTMLTATHTLGATILWNPSIVNSVLFSPTVGTTPYIVTATLSNCSSTDQADITVIPLPEVNATVDISICEDKDTVLTAFNPNGALISWNNFITDSTPFTPPIGLNDYIVTAELNGCFNTNTMTLYSKTYQNIGFTYLRDEFCTDEKLISPIVNDLGGVFTANNGLIIDPNLGTIQLSIATQNEYTITYFKDDILCPIDSNLTIYIFEHILANAGASQVLKYRFESELFADPAIFGTGTWLSIDGIPNIDDTKNNTSTVSKLSYGVNTFEWTIENGTCPLSVDSIIIYVEELLIPQAITPNNDNENDLFILKELENKENKIQIFTSWGELVFTSINNDQYWDGTDVEGTFLINDTYFYSIEIENEPIYKGFVLLKR